MFVRSAESAGNLSGTLQGWTDSKLSDYGRKQAFSLCPLLEPALPLFAKAKAKEGEASVHSSDLARAYETAFYALGFPNEELIQRTHLLREINMGSMEGVYYDSLDSEKKDQIASLDF